MQIVRVQHTNTRSPSERYIFPQLQSNTGYQIPGIENHTMSSFQSYGQD